MRYRQAITDLTQFNTKLIYLFDHRGISLQRTKKSNSHVNTCIDYIHFHVLDQQLEYFMAYKNAD